MTAARIGVTVLFASLLTVGLASRPMRYHACGNRTPYALTTPADSFLGKNVRVAGTVAPDSGVVLRRGPLTIRVAPLRGASGIWILFPASTASLPSEQQTFEGRLVRCTEVPFLRREMAAVPAMDSSALVLEEGNVPRRKVVWVFVGVVVAVFAGSQGLLSLWSRIRRS
ncbi:MAG: hypothetical protein ONB23_01990 [candidate division KSB1 bacterium]|nr:hypothetical protein [candidate division KSB1 bacterium]